LRPEERGQTHTNTQTEMTQTRNDNMITYIQAYVTVMSYIFIMQYFTVVSCYIQCI